MYKKSLKQAGYKITKPRQLVIDYFKKNKHPISVKKIYQSLENDLDKVTIYRILEVLEEVGIVFKEYGNEGATYYLSNKYHHHIVCNKCGHIECVPCNHIFKTIKNFSNIKHQLSLTGLCNKCNNK